MKSHIPHPLVIILLVLSLSFWFLRETEHADITFSPPRSVVEESVPSSACSIPTPTSPPPTSLIETIYREPALPLPDNIAQAKEADPIDVSAKSDASTNSVTQAILQRVQENRVPLVDVHSENIIFAIGQYKQTMGSYPSGDSCAVSSALMGHNSRGLTFIEGHGWTNKQGELLDPWRTPYDIVITNGSLTVRSAGSNGVMGDADDVVNVRPLSGRTTTPSEKKNP